MQKTQETWVRSLGQEDPLEEEMADTPVFLPGKSHGQRSLEGYIPWDHKESDTTEHACITGIQASLGDQKIKNSAFNHFFLLLHAGFWFILALPDQVSLS